MDRQEKLLDIRGFWTFVGQCPIIFSPSALF